MVGTDSATLGKVRSRFSGDVSDHTGYGGGGASWRDERIVQFLTDAIAAGMVYDLVKASVRSVPRWRRLVRIAGNDYGAFPLDEHTAEAFARWFIMESYVEWEHVRTFRSDAPLEWRARLHAISFLDPTWYLELDDPDSLTRFFVEVTDGPGLPILGVTRRERISEEQVHAVPSVGTTELLNERSLLQRYGVLLRSIAAWLRKHRN